MAKKRLRFLYKLRKQFTTGFLAIVPISITLFLVWWLFKQIDSLIRVPLEKLLGFYFYGIGFVVLILLIWLVGFIASSYFGSQLVKFQESLFSKIPVFGTIFKTIRQLSHSVITSRKDSFSQAVLVEVFNNGSYSIGFLTSKRPVVVEGQSSSMFHVFVPTAPNPTSGFLILVEDKKIIRLGMSVEEAFKSVVSAGMVSPTSYMKGASPEVLKQVAVEKIEEEHELLPEKTKSPEKKVKKSAEKTTGKRAVKKVSKEIITKEEKIEDELADKEPAAELPLPKVAKKRSPKSTSTPKSSPQGTKKGRTTKKDDMDPSL